MQVAAEKILQEKIVVEVFTEQSSKQLFILIIREKIVIETRVASKSKLLNCVIRYVQLILAAFWTDHLFYFTGTHSSGNYGSYSCWIMEVVQVAWVQFHKAGSQLRARETPGTSSEHTACSVQHFCRSTNSQSSCPRERAPAMPALGSTRTFPTLCSHFLQHSEQGRTSACSAFSWTFNLIFYAFCWYNREPKYKKHLCFSSV